MDGDRDISIASWYGAMLMICEVLGVVQYLGRTVFKLVHGESVVCCGHVHETIDCWLNMNHSLFCVRGRI